MNNTTFKQCYVCKEVKELTQFTKGTQCKSGYTNRCKECTQRYKAEVYAQYKQYQNMQNIDLPSTIICLKCKVEKPIDEFSKNSQYKDGVRRICKECQRGYNAEYVNNGHVLNESGMKICNRCHKEKTYSEFHNHAGSPDGHHNYCKQCNKEHRENTKEKIKERRHIYNVTHHEKLYYQNNIHRGYGLTYLNKPFNGAHRHHLHLERTDYTVCIPNWLHTLYPHRSTTWLNMDTVNAIALDYWINEEIYEY